MRRQQQQQQQQLEQEQEPRRPGSCVVVLLAQRWPASSGSQQQPASVPSSLPHLSPQQPPLSSSPTAHLALGLNHDVHPPLPAMQGERAPHIVRVRVRLAPRLQVQVEGVAAAACSACSWGCCSRAYRAHERGTPEESIHINTQLSE